MAPPIRLLDALTISRLLGGLAVVLAGLAAIALLFPRPLADAFFAAWVLFAVTLAVVGALGAWTRRTALVWVAALLLSGLTVVGMWSLGPFVAPAALVLLKTLAGAVLVVVGASIAYEGTVVRELFTRGCSSETLDCALAVTRWDAVGLSVLGLAAVGIGGWTVWTQLTVGRILASNQTG